MPLYICLIRFTDQGIKTIKNYPKRLEEARRIIEEAGAKVLRAYVTLGRYDQILLMKCPNNEVAVRLSAKLGSLGNVKIETLPAIRAKRFIKIAEKL